jgi:PhzF family phenazine biosynthesis protein
VALTIYHVDAFASRPFAGNPAAVCLLPELRQDAWMQALAAEVNLSETAFLVAREAGFDLRWFTPSVEVDLCGHATLASAHVLWQTGRLAPDDTARFSSPSGTLLAKRNGDWIDLDFPATPPRPAPDEPGLEAALGFRPRTLMRSVYDYLVEAASEAEVRALTPDFGLLARLPARGVIVTSRADEPQYDFVSRFFAPAAGINEDPVTGSAHCCLGPFWGERLNKTEMLAYQASARGGVVRVRLAGDRVLLGGQAVTVMRSELLEDGSAPVSSP